MGETNRIGKRKILKELTDLALSADFRELANAQDIYCPFESLRISRVEIRHSNFLANILNPLANHGFGECVLRNLLDKLLTASGDHALRLELALSDLGRIEVFREFHNMDVTIHLPDLTPSLVCIIELKVDAHEHSGQLQRYAENAANLWPNASRRFYLVSPTGMDASHDDWNTLSFSEIVAALKAAYAEPVGSPLAKSMLRAYIDLLRRLFVPDEKMEELARKLWQKHGQTLEYLIDQRPSPMRDISQAVQSEESIAGIIEGISQRTGIEIAKDSSSNTYLRFYIPAWEQDPDMPFGDFTASKACLLSRPSSTVKEFTCVSIWAGEIPAIANPYMSGLRPRKRSIWETTRNSLPNGPGLPLTQFAASRTLRNCLRKIRINWSKQRGQVSWILWQDICRPTTRPSWRCEEPEVLSFRQCSATSALVRPFPQHLFYPPPLTSPTPVATIAPVTSQGGPSQ